MDGTEALQWMKAQSRIMIIDDTQANVILLERILQIDGYRNVVGLLDSKQALDLYGVHQPDLVLLDLNMPHPNGYEVMEQLLQFPSSDFLPIIVITAQNDQETCNRALENGAMDFITKPFNHREVLNRIRNALALRYLNRMLREDNRNLEQMVQQRTEEIQSLQVELIHRLSRAAEFRDTDTGGHILRIGLYVQAVAIELGIDETEHQMLVHAAAMHDIGKIGIEDRILLKPGPLTEEEWAIMHRHPAIGAHILSGSHSEMVNMAEIIALTHHERWDGSGYPSGLKGEEIPLVGRMTAVCDVYDALVSERPYKSAWDHETSVATIVAGSGILFDPQVVEAFLRVIPRIREIFTQNR